MSGLVYVGTACSFPAHLQSGTDAAPLREEDLYPASPESAYGWSKLMGQYEAELLELEGGIPVSVLMLHNVYGTPTDYSDKRGQVIPALVRKAIAYPDEPFVVWGSGAQGRAFVHVDDVVDALVATVPRGFGQGAIQIGPDVCTSIREIAEPVVAISGKDIRIEYDLSAPRATAAAAPTSAKARTLLGWTPEVSLDGRVRAALRAGWNAGLSSARARLASAASKPRALRAATSGPGSRRRRPSSTPHRLRRHHELTVGSREPGSPPAE